MEWDSPYMVKFDTHVGQRGLLRDLSLYCRVLRVMAKMAKMAEKWPPFWKKSKNQKSGTQIF